jgi:hypothetical protein
MYSTILCEFVNIKHRHPPSSPYIKQQYIHFEVLLFNGRTFICNDLISDSCHLIVLWPIFSHGGCIFVLSAYTLYGTQKNVRAVTSCASGARGGSLVPTNCTIYYFCVFYGCRNETENRDHYK